MDLPKRPSQRSVKPAGGQPTPRKVPHVAAPGPGKPRVVAKRIQPRVTRRPRPLPPGFKPRFPDKEDFLTASKPAPKWRTRYYAVAIVLHIGLIAFFGYKFLYMPAMMRARVPNDDLPEMKIVGEGLKPVGPENIPAPPAPPDRNLNKLVDAAPAQQAPTPGVCVKCKGKVKPPYIVCFTCKNKGKCLNCGIELDDYARRKGYKRCLNCVDGGGNANGGMSYYDRHGNFVLGDDD